MAQAFERAGDHTKNLAEELFHLVRGIANFMRRNNEAH